MGYPSTSLCIKPCVCTYKIRSYKINRTEHAMRVYTALKVNDVKSFYHIA